MKQELGILLVEDNDFDVKRVVRGFDKLGRKGNITRARDGVEALNIIRGECGCTKPSKPFVVMLDLNMPRMGGIEFLDEIRADETLRSTLVFVVTTSDYHADVRSAYSRMVCGYFLKPDTADEMVAVLSTLVRYWDSCVFSE